MLSIRYFRKRAGLGLREAARRLKLSDTLLALVENEKFFTEKGEKKLPGMELFRKMGRLYKCKITDLVELKRTPDEETPVSGSIPLR